METVTGVVSDQGGPIPGVNVVVKGTNRGTQTDFDGKYLIDVKKGEELIFKHETFEQPLDFIGFYFIELVIASFRIRPSGTDLVTSSSISAMSISNLTLPEMSKLPLKYCTRSLM